MDGECARGFTLTDPQVWFGCDETDYLEILVLVKRRKQKILSFFEGFSGTGEFLEVFCYREKGRPGCMRRI